MDLKKYQKPEKKKEKLIKSVRISEEDYNFIKKNNISLGKIISEFVNEAKDVHENNKKKEDIKR
jgi:hypothetical protein